MSGNSDYTWDSESGTLIPSNLLDLVPQPTVSDPDSPFWTSFGDLSVIFRPQLTGSPYLAEANRTEIDDSAKGSLDNLYQRYHCRVGNYDWGGYEMQFFSAQSVPEEPATKLTYLFFKSGIVNFTFSSRHSNTGLGDNVAEKCRIVSNLSLRAHKSLLQRKKDNLPVEDRPAGYPLQENWWTWESDLQVSLLEATRITLEQLHGQLKLPLEYSPRYPEDDIVAVQIHLKVRSMPMSSGITRASEAS